MRTHGTLTKWHDDRGFGFIASAQGNAEIFVHISAFPRDGERPRINELISFETEPGSNGKLRAVRVMRPGQRTVSRRPRATGRSDRSTGLVGIVLGLLAIAAVGAYGLRFTGPARESAAVQAAAASLVPSTTFKCDGRTTCSQMTSCAEAKYFLRHCPNPKDGWEQ
jgi:cold shock CspA family protein